MFLSRFRLVTLFVPHLTFNIGFNSRNNPIKIVTPKIGVKNGPNVTSKFQGSGLTFSLLLKNIGQLDSFYYTKMRLIWDT